jgi:hypothetical protein
MERANPRSSLGGATLAGAGLPGTIPKNLQELRLRIGGPLALPLEQPPSSTTVA